MNIPKNLRYAKTHEWVENLGDGKARVGLTDHAQESLGDIVFVNLPEVGDAVTAGERLADVESVKAASDVYSPLSGKVSAVNQALLDDPAVLNSDPYGAWLAELCDTGDGIETLSAEEYEAFIEEA